MKIHPDVFFVIQDGRLVAWNYRNHEQYELSLEHLAAMVNSGKDADESKLADLTEARLLVTEIEERKWGWDLLSQMFHIGTSAESLAGFDVDPVEEAKRYVEYCTSIADDMPNDAFSYRRGEPIEAPKASHPRVHEVLLNLLENRKTNRSFSGESISLASVLEVLSETFRYRDHDHALYRAHGMATPTRRRSSPSAGSLQSCEAYLIARNVEGLAPGIYHYWSDADKLGKIAPLPDDFSFGKMNAGQMFSDDLSAGLILTCRFDKLAWKYAHSRTYRVALLDAGHLSQTFQLMATAVGLRTWLTGMFFDFNMRSMLGLGEDSQEYPLLSLGLGTGKYAPFDKNLGSQ
ncbi:MAG: SagB/ThcOx family dehydrogenase [Pseudomonadota bacterium]